MKVNLNYNVTVELTDSGLKTWAKFFVQETEKLQANNSYDPEVLGFKMKGNQLTGPAWKLFAIFGDDLQKLRRPFDMNVYFHKQPRPFLSLFTKTI